MPSGVLSSMINGLKARGAIADMSSPVLGQVLETLLSSNNNSGSGPNSSGCKGVGVVSAYAGFDPTGPSLHLGHLAVAQNLGSR